jgi:hypothetical protein
MAMGGEGFRRDRTQEVAGSSPASSTTEKACKSRPFIFATEAEGAEMALWSSFGQVPPENHNSIIASIADVADLHVVPPSATGVECP